LPSEDNLSIYPSFGPRLILIVVQFDEKDLQEYRQIWKEEFQEEISLEDARQSASMLMELFALLIQPLPETSPGEPESSLPG
jgi:hypothetical protein